MAQIYKQLISINLLVLRPDNAKVSQIVNDEILGNIQTVVQELVGEHIIVEFIENDVDVDV